MQAPMPDLDETIAAAEREAAAAFAQPTDVSDVLPAEPALAVATNVPLFMN